MNEYTIYFEIFGKKMKYICMAESESEAKQMLYSKIKFERIESEPITNDSDEVDFIKQLLDIES